MKLQTQLLLLGVVGPALALASTLTFAAISFRRELESDLDRRLLTQAAVESVSLFDTPTQEPHLHVATSPLVEQVRAFAPRTALYDEQRNLVVHYPPQANVPPQWSRPATFVPRLETLANERVLSVRVRAPSQQIYTLVLDAELIHIDSSLRRFVRAAGLGSLAVLLLVAAWVVLASRRLRTRVAALAMPISDQELTAPNVASRDEIDAVRTQLVRARTEELNILAARERFMANAAHQLKTPLAVLQTELDLAVRRTRTADEQLSVLQNAKVEVERLSKLAHALLDYEAVRLQTMPVEQFDLAPVIASVLEHSSRQASAKHIVLQNETHEALWMTGSLTWMEQALANLVHNAIHYSPDHTLVIVRGRSTEHRVEVDIEDQGPGLSNDEALRAFEPFVRLRQQSDDGGAGLGLPIAAEVARRHQGTLRMKRREVGSCFCLSVSKGTAKTLS